MSDANELEYILPDCNFAELETGRADDNECTPKFKNVFTDFIGIVINGPKEMVWLKGIKPEEANPFGTTRGPARLMIAGAYNLPFHIVGSNNWASKLLFVAIDQNTKKVYSGRIPTFGMISEDIDMDPNKIIGSYANADLVNIAGVPIANAIYTVYATVGVYKSNVLIIKTVVK